MRVHIGGCDYCRYPDNDDRWPPTMMTDDDGGIRLCTQKALDNPELSIDSTVSWMIQDTVQDTVVVGIKIEEITWKRSWLIVKIFKFRHELRLRSSSKLKRWTSSWSSSSLSFPSGCWYGSSAPTIWSLCNFNCSGSSLAAAFQLEVPLEVFDLLWGPCLLYAVMFSILTFTQIRVIHANFNCSGSSLAVVSPLEVLLKYWIPTYCETLVYAVMFPMLHLVFTQIFSCQPNHPKDSTHIPISLNSQSSYSFISHLRSVSISS